MFSTSNLKIFATNTIYTLGLFGLGVGIYGGTKEWFEWWNTHNPIVFSNKKINDELTYRRSGETELSRLIGESNLDERFERERKMVKFLFENMKKSGRLKVYDENLNLLHPGFELPQDMFLQPSDPNEKLVF